ncbi:DUF6634 family protein [Paracoccus sp. TOH]|uniref:DUF6634 family protein n=1 Tax=Paracoccus sp. TOH TaxID=1263728 RepID=UPI00339D55E7
MKLSPSDRAWFDKVLRAIAAAEAGPSQADLAQAPVLSDWKAAISPCGHIMLWGEVTDHPLLGNASIHTSQLIAIDPKAGWARTASRWYRLGRPIAALEGLPSVVCYQTSLTTNWEARLVSKRIRHHRHWRTSENFCFCPGICNTRSRSGQPAHLCWPSVGRSAMTRMVTSTMSECRASAIRCSPLGPVLRRASIVRRVRLRLSSASPS